MSESELFSKVLFEDSTDKFFQWRLSVTEFRGVQYLSVRKYFLSFEGEWCPSKEGATMPLTVATTARMFFALADILSEVETSYVSDELQELIKEYKANVAT